MELHPNSAYPKSNTRYHTANVLTALDNPIRHLREDAHKFDEPKAQALFETTAEVPGGLRTAFRHYEDGAEPAMREPRGHWHFVTPSSHGHPIPPTSLSRKRL